MVGGGIQ